MDNELNKTEGQADYTSWPPANKRKLPFQLEKRDNSFAFFALIFSIFSSVFGIFGGYALGYLVSSALMTALFLIYFAKGGKARFLSAVCCLLSLANSAVFICTTNGSVRLFCAIISFLLALVCFDGQVNGKTIGNRQTLGIFLSALSTIGSIAASVKALFSGGNGGKKAIGKAFVGFVCAIPVLIVVLPLLLSSDAAFLGMMRRIVGNSFSAFFKVIFGILLSLFVISYGFSMKKGRFHRVGTGRFAGIDNMYILSFLSVISLCYVLYLFSQLAYFFSAFRGFLPDGEITYAQYARKGFFEMCAIAVINLGIVFCAILLAKKHNGKACGSIQAVTTFIGIFTLIIIATAISKMLLYIDAYGMTVLRLTTSAFMVFLGIVFISVILRIYFNRINMIKIGLIAAGCIVLVLGSLNVNTICAKYNYQCYQSGKLPSIDVKAIYALGDEGIPYIVKLASDENADVAQEAQDFLTIAYLHHYFDNMQQAEDFTVDTFKKNEKNRGFERFSIPRAAAYESLYQFLEENPHFPFQ